MRKQELNCPTGLDYEQVNDNLSNRPLCKKKATKGKAIYYLTPKQVIFSITNDFFERQKKNSANQHELAKSKGFDGAHAK